MIGGEGVPETSLRSDQLFLFDVLLGRILSRVHLIEDFLCQNGWFDVVLIEVQGWPWGKATWGRHDNVWRVNWEHGREFHCERGLLQVHIGQDFFTVGCDFVSRGDLHDFSKLELRLLATWVGYIRSGVWSIVLIYKANCFFLWRPLRCSWCWSKYDLVIASQVIKTISMRFFNGILISPSLIHNYGVFADLRQKARI